MQNPGAAGAGALTYANGLESAMGTYVRKAPEDKKQSGRPRAALPWLVAVAEGPPVDSCVRYPFKLNVYGYGVLYTSVGRKNRKTARAHRFVCELAHGAPPSPEHFALHACDNPACVNPRHLRWGTAQDNSDDMVARDRAVNGLRHMHAKLTPALVRDVRRRAAAGEMQKDIAADLQMARSVICEVVNRKAWKHVK